jgi:cytidylate kinase
MIVTVDGPAASGKGAVCKSVALRHKFIYFDIGLIYRLCAYAISHGAIKISELLDQTRTSTILGYTWRSHGPVATFFGEDITSELKENRYGNLASELCQDTTTIEILNQFARNRAKHAPNFICDGRNTGSTIFPYADKKFFLTATLEKRAERRYKELALLGKPVSIEALIAQMQERDKRDEERAHSGLTMTEEAVLIDTSDLTITECSDLISSYLFST